MLRIGIVFGIIAIATILVAFTSFDDGLPPLPDDPEGRGAFVFAVPNDPGSLDPNTTSASTDFRVVKLLYEPLLVVPWGGGIPEPGTASALPTISEDGLTYTFTIRDDAMWSDGHPVDANDFVYGWRRALLPDSGSQYASLLYLIDGAQDFFYFRQGLLNFDTLEESFSEDAAREAFLAKFPNLEELSRTLDAEAKWELTLEMFDEMVGIQALDSRAEQFRLFRLGLMDFSTITRASVSGPEALGELVERYPDLPQWSEEMSGQEKLDMLVQGFDEIIAVNGRTRQFRVFREVLSDYSAIDDENICGPEQRQALIERYPDLQQWSEELDDQEKLDLAFQEFDELVAIDDLDSRTIQVRLKAPTAYFIDLCAFPTFSPMPEHVLEQYTELNEDGAWMVDPTYFGDARRVVSNGPYYLRDWQQKVRMIFDQNPHYWNREAMGNVRIVEETIPDTSLQVLRYEEGELDWIPDVGEIAQDLIPAGYEDIHAVPVAGTYYYHFNCRDELPNGVPNPMADARVRRAMAMCINRQQIVDDVTQLQEPVARLIVPYEDIPGYTGPEDAGIRYNPEAGKELLAEAGYPDGEGFPPIKILVNNDSGPGHTNIALVIKKSWEENLGIQVDIEAIEFKVLLDRSANGDFFVRRAGWYGDYADPTTWLDMHRTEDANNHGAYYNEDFERLLREAAVELDREARFELLRQAEAILMHDAPIVPLYYYVNVMMYDEDRIDLRPNAWNNLRLELIPVQRGEDE